MTTVFDHIRWARTQTAQRRLKPSQAHTLLALATYCNRTGCTSVGARRLGPDLGLSKSQVSRLLKQLRDLGLVRRAGSHWQLLSYAQPAAPAPSDQLSFDDGFSANGNGAVKAGELPAGGGTAVPALSVEVSPRDATGCSRNESHGCAAGVPSWGGRKALEGLEEPPLPPKGGRRREQEQFEEQMQTWSRRHFPTADPRSTQALVAWLRTRDYEQPITADLMRELAPHYPAYGLVPDAQLEGIR